MPLGFDNIKLGDHVGTEHAWELRKKLVLNNVYTSIGRLVSEAKNQEICTSLAVFKPFRIVNFIIENDRRDWKPHVVKQLKEKAKQSELFQDSDSLFDIVKKIPYKFSYEFLDAENKVSTLMIADWEIGQLYWNCLKRYANNEDAACDAVKKKYFDDFAKTKDLHLFLGTTRLHHFIAPNPFIIVGTFHPPTVRQIELF